MAKCRATTSDDNVHVACKGILDAGRELDEVLENLASVSSPSYENLHVRATNDEEWRDVSVCSFLFSVCCVVCV